MALKMSPEERVYLEKLVAFSGKDINTVRCILRSILVLFVHELYGDEKEAIIPYIGNFKWSFSSKTTPAKGTHTYLKLKTDPCRALDENMAAVYEGNKPDCLEFFEKQRNIAIEETLEVEEDDLF